jgi:hypothetical protein
MTVTFSVPVTSVKVTIQDPTFAGNTVQAFDPNGAPIVNYAFLYSGQPGVNIPDYQTITGKIARLELTPAANDYVAYQILVTIGRQYVLVDCTPSSPTRGQTVQCKTHLSVPQAFTVVKRRAKGSGFTVNDNIPALVLADGEDNWQGTAVATSELKVTVRIDDNGTTRELSNDYPAGFTITKRTWPDWEFRTLVSTDFVLAGKMVPYPTSGTPIGFMQTETPLPADIVLDRATSGPNRGMAYIRDSFVVSDYTIALHPAMDPSSSNLTPASPEYSDVVKWYNDQNGKPNGTCPQSDLPQLITNVKRHEGVGLLPNSHPGEGNFQFRSLKPQDTFEALYTTKPDEELRKKYDSEITKFFNSGPYRSAQDAFDRNDTPFVFSVGLTVIGGVVCKFDSNPSDK